MQEEGKTAFVPETESSLSDMVPPEAVTPPPKKKAERSVFEKKKIRSYIFVACMLAYPVLQFVVMWAFVNFDSILMTFQRYDTAVGWKFAGLANYFSEIEAFFIGPTYSMVFVNSLLHSLVGMFIIFPLCLIIAYFLCKKMPAAGFFRVVFYLPSIIPLVVLALGFSNMLKPDGLIGGLYQSFTGEEPALLAAPQVRWTVYGFTIWAGIGGNLLLLSGTIKRVPAEVLESARLDGVGTMGELFRIIIPMIWPTLVTMFVMSMMGIFSVVFQPFFLSNSTKAEAGATIGLWIFLRATDNAGNAQAATLGILYTLVVAPVILLTRWGLDRMFTDVDY